MRDRMTAEQATQFQRTSEHNAAVLRNQLKCSCNPYSDIFTYNRWQAQGLQVKRGEHGYRLPLVKVVEDEEDETKARRILGTSVVFCRCQVQAKNGNGHKPEPAATPAPVGQTYYGADGEAYPNRQLHRDPKTVPADPVMTGWKVV